MSFPKYPEVVLVGRRPEIFSVREVGLTSCSPLVVAVLAYAWRGEVPKPLHAACVAGLIACAYGLTR